MSLRQLILSHARRYPLMQPVDYAKLIYQGAFAGGHLITSPESALNRLKEEISSLIPSESPLFEPVAGGLARLYLEPARRAGLRPETMARLFVYSSAAFKPDSLLFEAEMSELEAMIIEGALPFDLAEVRSLRARCRDGGYKPFSHSETYRAAYAPAYRIVQESFVKWFDLLAAIDALLSSKGSARIAIDGNSGGGKSTLSALLQQIYDAQLFHMDDFFLPFERKTPARLVEPGGNVDYERFQADILNHLAQDSLTYRPYVCHEGALGDAVTAQKKSVQLVEGVYSLHPKLNADYDLRVFLGVNPALQSERILARNGVAMHNRFMNEWIPMENHYFEAFRVPSRCDLIYMY